MIRAVLDTSALFSPRLRRQLQEADVQGLYKGIWSPWIIAELNRMAAAYMTALSTSARKRF